MASVKTVVLFTLIGAVLGTVVVDFIAPAAIAWDHTPRAGAALCNCGELSHSVATAMIQWQAAGSALGAVGFLVLGVLWELRQRKKQLAPA
ncbi:MAG: hypothetical protein JNK82_10860 [Myxococcaceae bacterium]|nr:hypothetical protein [Myxococcaceae bacterium]